MSQPAGVDARVLRMREAFDRAFAVAAAGGEAFEDMLAIRVAGDAYALRVGEIKGVLASRKIVPLPSKRRELLGVAGVRGSLVAVYSLAALLGYELDREPPSWLVLAGSPEPIGLGFSGLEGFVRARRADIHAGLPGEGARLHLAEVVGTGTGSRPVVDITSALGALALFTKES